MSEVVMVPNCACGQRMVVARTGVNFLCMNCDGLQAIEVGRNPQPRIKSAQDRAFDKFHEKRIFDIYTNKKQEEGPTNGEQKG